MDFLVVAWSIPKGKIRKFSLFLAIPVAVLAYFLGVDPILCAALAVAILWMLPHIFKACVKKFLMPIMTNNRRAASPHIRRATDFFVKEDYDRAIVEYGVAISINRYDVSAYNVRGGLFSLQNQYDYAIVDYTSAIDMAPKLLGLDWTISDSMDILASAYNGRGRAYFTKKQFDLAIEDFSAAIALLSILGQSKALQELRIDEDVSYSLSRAFDYRGRSYLAKGDYDSAVDDFGSSLRFDPYDGNDYEDRIVRWVDENRIVRRADEHCESREYDLAIAGYTLAIHIDPDFAGHYCKRGLAYLAKGEYDLAIADFDTAISISPDFDEMIYEHRDKAFKAKENSEPVQ